MRSPTLLPIRMNAAETSASRAIADWTPLTVVSRSRTTAEIDTFISDVSTTSTNMAIARRTASRMFSGGSLAVGPVSSVTPRVWQVTSVVEARS
jgi:long-subunit fatty acid transport protein